MPSSPTKTPPSGLPRDTLSLSRYLDGKIPAVHVGVSDLLTEEKRLILARRIGERMTVDLILDRLARGD